MSEAVNCSEIGSEKAAYFGKESKRAWKQAEPSLEIKTITVAKRNEMIYAHDANLQQNRAPPNTSVEEESDESSS